MRLLESRYRLSPLIESINCVTRQVLCHIMSLVNGQMRVPFSPSLSLFLSSKLEVQQTQAARRREKERKLLPLRFNVHTGTDAQSSEKEKRGEKERTEK